MSATPLNHSAQYDAAVIGAGFGGMGAAIQLKRLGLHNIVILEREDDLGGTWHVNRYPGLAVDIPSSTYSYSFEPNPNWSRLYAPGAELKAYSDHVADKYGLRELMRFNSVVEGARWDEDNEHWIVNVATATSHQAESITAKYLLAATGFLSQPRMPDIPGIETFAGKVIHTTKWDDSYDLAGKKAAVIGTGATAVQLIPEIAPVLDELTVYQRTAIWVTPKSDGPIPLRVRKMFKRFPVTQRVARRTGSAILEVI
ncbi:MAG: NAD(P)/FAD-dependent oxidoreductase, partial [Aeromicrobium sp.]